MELPLPRLGNSPPRVLAASPPRLVAEKSSASASRAQPAPAHIEQEQIWKSRYSLLREFMDFMTPLYQVLKGTDEAPQTKQHFIVVPPDDALEQRGLLMPGGRVSHTTVRAHVVSRSRSDGAISTMLGAAVHLALVESEAAIISAPPSTRASGVGGGATSATTRMSSPPTAVNGVGGARRESGAIPRTGSSVSNRLRDNIADASVAASSSTATFIRGSGGSSLDLFAGHGTISVTHASGVRCEAEIVGLEKLRGGSSVGSGGCLVLLFVSAPLVPARDEAVNKRIHTSISLVPIGHAGAASRRSVVEGQAGDLGGSLRYSSMPQWQRRPCFGRKVPPTSDADSFRAVLEEIAAENAAAAADTESMLKCDNAMTHVDTELAMFCSSYVCMPGFEEYIVARVNQITEGGIERFQEDSSSADEGASSSAIDEDQNEEVIVAFHTIVTAGVSEMLLQHWERTNEVEDIAFHHACTSLGRKMTVGDVLASGGCQEAAVEQCDFEPAIAMMIDLDEQPGLSVLSYMRLMESIIALVVEAVTAVLKDVTADVCIPLVVYVIVAAAPRRLPSILKFIMDFMIPILEMSSLGYSYTTFEAAAAQVMEEYLTRVQNKV